jgi:hypothetical protein
MPTDDIPEILEGQVPANVPRTDRAYLEIPTDEIPLVDPRNPGRATGQPIKEFRPEVLMISVTWDHRPLMEAVNEAVNSNDINRVIKIFNGTRLEAKREGAAMVRVDTIPGR